MSIVMDMSSYEIERGAQVPEDGRMAMFANWSSAASPMCQQHSFAPAGVGMPANLASADAEMFLRRMSAQRL